nr:hypothetical protein [Tanacetum cinerariifolium]
MAISIISISSDSTDESVGTSTARVILFGMIPTTIPPTLPTADLPVIYDDTSQIPTKTPTIPPTAPTIQYTSPFICTDSSDSDTFKRPPSPPIRQILTDPPSLPCRSVILVLPEQPILVGRPYRTQPNRRLHHANTSSDSSSRHSSSGHTISDSPFDSPTATSTALSHKRHRGIRIDSVTDFEVSSEDGYEPYVPRETGLGVDVEDSYEPYTEPDIDPNNT